MELMELLKQARDGKMPCPKCGAPGVALCNVKIRMGTPGPSLEPGAYLECRKCRSRTPMDRLQNGGKAGIACAVCSAAIPEEKMKSSPLAGMMAGLLPGLNAKTMPNVMEGLAMKCNRCGLWICGACAEKTAMSQGAGSIRHSDCGGMFETP